MMIDIDGNLIEDQRNTPEVFAYQQKLLEQADHDKTKLIDLALLQTLSPYGDYNSAASILKYATKYVTDIRTDIIGYYISLMWHCSTLYFFKNRVKNEYASCLSEYKSLVFYLQGYELYLNKRYSEALMLLNESVKCFDGHVCNYILLSKLSHDSMSVYFIEKARLNLQLTNDLLEISDYADPDNYIDEFISGRKMSLDTFLSIKKELKPNDMK